MITEGTPYFLSRPRRFGKSLLISTLAAVFEGRRDLFEGFTTEGGFEQPELFIARSDWQWEKYPVLRFDFSNGDMVDIEQLALRHGMGYAEKYRLDGRPIIKVGLSFSSDERNITEWKSMKG